VPAPAAHSQEELNEKVQQLYMIMSSFEQQCGKQIQRLERTPLLDLDAAVDGDGATGDHDHPCISGHELNQTGNECLTCDMCATMSALSFDSTLYKENTRRYLQLFELCRQRAARAVAAAGTN
jgi:hypothetical protein